MAATRRETPKKKRYPRKRARDTLERLSRAIPEPRLELDYADPWQLVIATILAAQATDKLVNTVTPVLFERWPTPQALGAAPQAEVEEVVRKTGYYRSKAQKVIAASRKLVEDFGGQVPRQLEALTTLPGVARKTANVVIGSAYGIPTGFIVDTHVGRVSRLLRLTPEKDPAKIEADLCELFPRDAWIAMGHRLVLHGRYVCKSRGPDCPQCPLNELCPGRGAPPPDDDWQARAEWERELIG